MIQEKIRNKTISIPDEYINVLDNLKNNVLICNRTDAIKYVFVEFFKAHPEVSHSKKVSKMIEKGQNTHTQNQEDILNTPSQFDVCFCNHPKNTHTGVKCIVKGCACEAFEIDVETTRRARAKCKLESSQ